MRSIILKSMLVFCMVVCAMGMIVIPFMMQFNQANPLLLNWFVMCVFGLLVAIMMYQTELEYEQEINELEFVEDDYDFTIKYKIYDGEIFEYNGEEYDGLDYEQVIEDTQEELQTLAMSYVKDEEEEDEL